MFFEISFNLTISRSGETAVISPVPNLNSLQSKSGFFALHGSNDDEIKFRRYSKTASFGYPFSK